MDALLTDGLLKTNGTVYIRGTLPRMDAPDPAIMLSSVDSLGLRVWMAGSLVYAKGTLGQDMPGADQSQELFGSDRLIPVSGSAQGQELLVEIHYNGEFIGLYGMEIRVGNRLVLVQQAQEDFVSLTLPNLALSAVSCLFGVFLILVAALRFRNDVKLLWYLGGLFLAMAVIFLPTGIMFQVFANPSGAILIYLSNFLVVSFIVLFYAEFIGAERLGWFGRFKPWLLWPSLAISGALLLVFVLSSMNLGESVEELRFMWLVSQGEWIGLLHTMFVVIAFGCVLIHMIGQKERNADYWMLIMVFGISLASTFFLDVGLPNLPWLNLTKQAAVLVSMTALFAAYLCLFAIPVLRFFRNEKLLVQRNQELQKANQVFHRFVPEEFLTYLGLQNMNDFRLGVHAEKTATIMFSDIRSFTNLAETMSPAEVLAFINTYLGLVGPCIAEAGGFIDKYLGDGIMAIFPESPRQGVAAALAMQAAVDGFNRSRDQAGLQPIQVGIGLHCGPVMLGTIGHQDRIDGTVLSDTVNTAARLESLTKLYRCSIIVGESVQAGLPDPPPCNLQFLDKIRVKGKRQAVAIYRVLPKLSAAERPALAESDSLYNEVWRLQSRGDLSAALAVLAKVPPRARLEGRWKLMAKRLERLEKLGVPPGWDGIDSLALK
jgi:class 3 adenylate cyclase